MKTNLIIENHFKQDIPEELQGILEFAFKDNRVYWESFGTAFWQENRDETRKRFTEMDDGSNIVVQTTLLDFGQLELMSLLLNDIFMKTGKSYNVYIVHPCLPDKLKKYTEQYESDITPDIEAFNYNPEAREVFKEIMYNSVLMTLKCHNVHWLNNYCCYSEDEKTLLERAVKLGAEHFIDS